MKVGSEPVRMLDTVIAAAVIRGELGREVQRLEALEPHAVCISAMTRAELVHAARRGGGGAAEARVNGFLKVVRTIGWDEAAADIYAGMLVDLEKGGVVMGDKDIAVLSHAKALGALLVTTREGLLKGLDVGVSLEVWKP